MKLLVLLILILATNVSSQEFPQHYDKYVNDFADIFSNNETNELKLILNEIEKNTTAELVIVTINTTKPLTPAEYRTKLFNEWKIGKKDKDNGLLILYSLQENRIEIETGYGLEGVLPDSKLGRLLDEKYVPYRDNKQVNQGIVLFTKEISKIINENKQELLDIPEKKWNYKILSLFIFYLPFIFLILLIIVFISFVKNRKKCEKDGLTMKCLGVAAGYAVYKCAKDHTFKIKQYNSNSGGWPGGFGNLPGGFGRSGGGFGGGSSGGGGVGR